MWEAVGTSVLAQTLATLGAMPNHDAKGVGTHSTWAPWASMASQALGDSLLEGLLAMHISWLPSGQLLGQLPSDLASENFVSPKLGR